MFFYFVVFSSRSSKCMEPREQSPQPQKQSQSHWLILLLIVACLGGFYFFILPLLTTGGSSASPSYPNGWSDTQQRQIAFDLAQRTQNYRQKVNEKRKVNYGFAYMTATDNPNQFRPDQPYDGMDARNDPKNDT